MNERGRGVLTVAVSLSVLMGVSVAFAPAATAAPSWSISVAAGPEAGSLYGVSCPSTTSCIGVGVASDARNTLTEHWNGTSWSVVPGGAGLTGSASPTLTSVACASVTSCFAVGYYFYPRFPPRASAVRPLVERWNGTSWSVMTRPVPPGARDAQLLGVSCRAPSSCVAVGYYSRPGSPTHTLVERWNGSRWSIVPSADRNVSYFNSVSCPGVASCYAVGGYSNSTSVDPTTFIEHWDGTNWSIVPSPNPSGSTTSELARVSCASMNNCIAVGESGTGSVFKTLVEHWNGKRWSVMSSPNPTGRSVVFLRGVSCPSTTSCNAVGYYYVGRGLRTLAEHWDGNRWAIVSSPNPTGGTQAFLGGVSCHTPTNCVAVGAYGKEATNTPLIERYR